MAFNINEMRSQLTLGGARPSQFQVRIVNAGNNVADIKTPFMVQAASIPPATITEIPVPYFGRKMKVAGDRTYDNWSVTILNDEDFLIRNAMEEWSNKINSFQGNVREFGSGAPLQYKSEATVTQYSKTGVPIREYTFHGLFPLTISEIALDWDTTDTIETFTVDFAYDWWDVSGGVTGNAGGS